MTKEVASQTPARREALLLAAAGLLGVSLLTRSDEAEASALGEENAALGAILAQIKEAMKQAKELKREYYDEHIKVAVDSYKEVKDATKTAAEAAETLNREKAAIDSAVGSILGQTKLALGHQDQVKLLADILSALQGVEAKHVALDREYSKIAGQVSPEQERSLRGKRRVLALIAESRTQSVSSEQKIGEIYKREQASITKLEQSGSTKVDQLLAAVSIKLSSVSDKLDEQIRLQAKTNDLLEAALQHQTTRDVDSRYDDRSRISDAAKDRVQRAGIGDWSGKRSRPSSSGKGEKS